MLIADLMNDFNQGTDEVKLSASSIRDKMKRVLFNHRNKTQAAEPSTSSSTQQETEDRGDEDETSDPKRRRLE